MERINLQVVFNFGSVAYVTVTKKDDETIEDAIKRRSENIEGYIKDGKYIRL